MVWLVKGFEDYPLLVTFIFKAKGVNGYNESLKNFHFEVNIYW